MFRIQHRAFLGVASIVAALALSNGVTAQGQGGGQGAFDGAIREKLNLHEWTLQDLVLPAEPGDEPEAQVVLEGALYRLRLVAYSLRDPRRFRVVLVDESGTSEAADVPPPATFRGTVHAADDDRLVGELSATHFAGQLSAMIRLDGEARVWTVQPVTDVDPAAPHSLHVVYETGAILPFAGICAADLLPPNPPDFDQQRRGGGGSYAPTGLEIVEVGVDADFSYYQWNGSVWKTTVRDTEKVFNDLEFIYERDTEITYEVTNIIVRKTAAGDPYTSNDPSTLLGEFQNHWNNTKDDVRRDTAHLMTGRNLSGSVIGIAYLGVICNLSSAYGLAQTTFTTNLQSRVALSAHEIGHNWDANHCDGAGDCSIMCSGIGGCSGNITKFGAGEQAEIEAFRDSRNCLDDLDDPIDPPFFDDFPSSTLDRTKWTYNDNCNISTAGVNEPSAPNSLRLNATGSMAIEQDDIRTNFIDLAGDSSGTLSYAIEHRGVENGEELIVEGWTKGKFWDQIATHVSDGTTQSNFTTFSHGLASNLLHAEFRVRFRSVVTSSDDTWFIDDVSITSTPAPPRPPTWDPHGIGPGFEGEITFRNTAPGWPVLWFGSLTGVTGGLVGIRGPLELDLRPPVITLGQSWSDERGVARLHVHLPPGLLVGDLFVQVLCFDSGHATTKSAPVAIPLR